jgi:hypothetical protein
VPYLCLSAEVRRRLGYYTHTKQAAERPPKEQRRTSATSYAAIRLSQIDRACQFQSMSHDAILRLPLFSRGS